MRKFLTALLIASIATAAFAQQKGDMFVGTMLGVGIQKSSVKYDNEKEEDDPIVTLNLEPGFHFFIADKFRLGLQMELTRQSQKSDDEGVDYTESMGTLLVGPVASYYVQLADRFYLTPELGAYFAHVKHKEEEGKYSEEVKLNGFALGLQPIKFEFRATNRLAISAGLFNIGFTHLKVKDTGDVDVKNNAFALNLGINPSVGIHIYL